jgi:hypothetical protein
MQNKILMGHLFALVTILLWGTTFISTKVLLRSFTPIEILFFRFIMGLIVLFLIYPYRLKVTDKKQEWIFAGAGLSGITLYYLFENIALGMLLRLTWELLRPQHHFLQHYWPVVFWQAKLCRKIYSRVCTGDCRYRHDQFQQCYTAAD